MEKIKFIDLFAGMGGIRLGFEQGMKEKGFETDCVLTSEIKEHAITVYSNYFRDSNICRDIRKTDADSIPDFDYLLGGFPCQAFSTAGKRRGFADTRGTLFFEIERILEEKHPRGFLLENVEGLVTHDSGNTFSTIINRLEALGYYVSTAVIDSADFGLAQSRKRLYITGRDDKKIELDRFPLYSQKVLEDIWERGLPVTDSVFTKHLLDAYAPEELWGKSINDKRGGPDNIHSWDLGIIAPVSDDEKRLMDAIMRERRKKKWAQEIGIEWMDGMPLTEKQIRTFFKSNDTGAMLSHLTQLGYLRYEYPKKKTADGRIPDTTKEKGYSIPHGKLSFEFTKILHPHNKVQTLTATDIAHLGVTEENGIRRLSETECKRLFGYPDNYDMSMLPMAKIYDLIGNTVCVPVIKEITKKLAET